MRRGRSIGGPTVEASCMSAEDFEVSAARIQMPDNKKLLIKINEMDERMAKCTTMSNNNNQSSSKIGGFTFY
jgi:hypothetical protein